jgi:hypothetical protein
MPKANGNEYFPAGLHIQVAIKADFHRQVDGVGCLT